MNAKIGATTNDYIGGENVGYILIEDNERCNFCEYWSGKRINPEDFVWVNYDTVEQGVCLNKDCFMYRRPSEACAGCSKCKCILPF